MCYSSQFSSGIWKRRGSFSGSVFCCINQCGGRISDEKTTPRFPRVTTTNKTRSILHRAQLDEIRLNGFERWGGRWRRPSPRGSSSSSSRPARRRRRSPSRPSRRTRRRRAGSADREDRRITTTISDNALIESHSMWRSVIAFLDVFQAILH